MASAGTGPVLGDAYAWVDNQNPTDFLDLTSRGTGPKSDGGFYDPIPQADISSASFADLAPWVHDRAQPETGEPGGPIEQGEPAWGGPIEPGEPATWVRPEPAEGLGAAGPVAVAIGPAEQPALVGQPGPFAVSPVEQAGPVEQPGQLYSLEDSWAYPAPLEPNPPAEDPAIPAAVDPAAEWTAPAEEPPVPPEPAVWAGPGAVGGPAVAGPVEPAGLSPSIEGPWLPPEPSGANPLAEDPANPAMIEFAAEPAAAVEDGQYWNVPVDVESPNGANQAELGADPGPARGAYESSLAPFFGFSPPPGGMAPSASLFGFEPEVSGEPWAGQGVGQASAPILDGQMIAEQTASRNEIDLVNSGGFTPYGALAAPVPAEAAAYAAELTADDVEDMDWEGPPEIGPDGRGPWLDGPDAPWGTAPSQSGRRAIIAGAWGLGIGLAAAIVRLFLLN
jgi:hypothetical protein